jgi:hypothetical protein
VRVPQLVRREAPPDTGRDRRPAKVGSGGGAGPVVTARRARENAEERPDGKFDSRLEPRLELGPSPCAHADLATASALAATNQHCAATLIEIGLGERERLLDAQPGAPENTIRPRSRRPWARSPAARMTAMTSSTLGGSAP